MTISEAINLGITELRLPEWNPHAKLSLQKNERTGKFGPWATLYDISAPKEGIPYCWIQDDSDRWEQAKGWTPLTL